MLTHSRDDAAAVATVVGFPVVAKLISPKLLHQSDANAVRLRLATLEAVHQAFDDLIAGAHQLGLDDAVEGVLIQPMVAVELDLNPVIVLPDGSGCRIIDARIRVGRRRRR